MTGPTKPQARLTDYLSLMQPNHWVEHVFILPQIVLALMLIPRSVASVWVPVVIGFVSTAMCASANYVLIGWFDAKSDVFHRSNALRPAVTRDLSPVWVWVEYGGLVVVGLTLVLIVLTGVDNPIFEKLTSPHYLTMRTD